MELTEDQINNLIAMKPEVRGQWLLEGFKNWFDPVNHYNAFPQINEVFSSYENIIDQLQELHDEYPEELNSDWWDIGLSSAVRICRKNMDEKWMLPLREILILAMRFEIERTFLEIKKHRTEWVNLFRTTLKSEDALRARAIMTSLFVTYSNREEINTFFTKSLRNGYFDIEEHINDIPLIFIKLLTDHPEDLGVLLKKTRPFFSKLIIQDNSFLANFSNTLINQVPGLVIRGFNSLEIKEPIQSLKNSEPIFDDKWLISILLGLDYANLVKFIAKKNTDNPILKCEEKFNEYPYRILENKFTLEEIHLPEFENILLKKLFNEIYNPTMTPKSKDWKSAIKKLKKSINDYFSDSLTPAGYDEKGVSYEH